MEKDVYFTSIFLKAVLHKFIWSILEHLDPYHGGCGDIKIIYNFEYITVFFCL